ncbi:MAG: DUF4149 domain-containing protein [Acidobacteriota bacterium]
MFVLRYAGLVALTIWVGGLIALGGVAAPAIFDVLGGSHVAGDRMLAGAIFGETLRRFHLLGYGCAGILIASLMARGVLGPRPLRFAGRFAVACAMGLAMLASGLIVSPRIARLQAAIGAAPSSLPPGDLRRVTFGRLHAASTGLLFVPVFGGLLLLYREMKD